MPDGDGFGRKATSGAALTLLAQVFRIGATFTSTIVVSRLLSPTDYGTYAMAAPVAGFALMFQNIGFDHAVVQSREISELQLSSLFWLNMALCAVLAIGVVAISPLVAIFYANPSSGYLVAASSALILATAPNPLFGAMLNRALRFHAQSIAEIVSALVMVASTVVAALLVRSYWALLIGAVAATLANTAAFYYFLRWRPKAMFNWASIVDLVKFGGGVSSYGFTQFLTRNLDNILLARFWGATSLGYYDRAYKLMLSPLQNFTSPMARNLLPILARTRDEPERFRRAYLLFVQAIACCVIPAVVAAATGSDDVVGLLLGARWQESAPIFRWLAATAALLVINETAIWLFISTSRTGMMVRWSMFASVSVVIGFVAGLPWGASGMAIAYMVGEAIRTPVLFATATRSTAVKMGDLYRIHLVTIGAAVVCLVMDQLIADRLPLLGRLACLTTGSYVGMLLVLPLTKTGQEILRIVMKRGRSMAGLALHRVNSA